MRKRLLLPAVMTLAARTTWVCSQVVVDQVIIANGGMWESTPPFTDYCTVGSYNPQNRSYNIFDTIYTQSVQSVYAAEGYAYVCSEDSLIKYDLSTYERVAHAKISGAQRVQVQGNYIIVSKGYGASSDYIEVRNKSDLTSFSNFPAISDQCREITIAADTAYVGVPGSWSATKGKLAVLDVSTWTLVRETDLDTLGKNIGAILKEGNMLYTVNSIGWGQNGVITHYNISTAQVEDNVQLGTPASAGILVQNNMLYANFGQGLGKYNVTSKQVSDTAFIPLSYAAGVFDTLNQLFYLTETDYFSYGKTYIYGINGTLADSIIVGISPEAIAVSYKDVTSVELHNEGVFSVTLFPNPSRGMTHVQSSEAIEQLLLTDIYGRIIKSFAPAGRHSVMLDLSDVSKGIYLVKLSSGEEVKIEKIIRQ